MVADTSWGLTYHTCSAAHPCPSSLSLCPSFESSLASGPRYPYHRSGFPFPPSSSFSPAAPPSRNATRHASGDTRGPTQVMHGPPYIFDPLFGLFFPTGSNVRGLSCPRRLLPFLPPSAPSLFLLALSRVGKITIVPPSLFHALSVFPPLSPSLVPAVCNTLWFRASILGLHISNACYCPPSYRYVRERHAGGFAA